MAGLHDTDIRLEEDWQLTAASTGDVPLCTARECFLQDIRLEAITTPGELFYSPSWGWGLQEFLQREYDDLTRLEISQRVKEKLSARPEVDGHSIQVELELFGERLVITVRFQFVEEDEAELLTISLDRVNVEVVEDVK